MLAIIRKGLHINLIGEEIGTGRRVCILREDHDYSAGDVIFVSSARIRDDFAIIYKSRKVGEFIDKDAFENNKVSARKRRRK